MPGSSSRVVGWGMIGCNGWAGLGPGPALLDAESARLVRVLSRDRERAKQAVRWMSGWHLAKRFAGEPFALKLRYSRPGRRLNALSHLGRSTAWRVGIETDLGRFLADPRIEVVWVVSPPDRHREHVEAALEAGKHVLCEKPMATNPDDARAMAEAARRSGRILALDYQMRQHPTHRALRDDCQAGRFGRIQSLRAVMRFKHPDPRPWHLSKSQSGGWAVCEAGTHLVDLALWFLGNSGEITNVSASLSHEKGGFETDDRAEVAITFESGAVARLDVDTMADHPEFLLEVEGTEGGFRCENTLFGGAGEFTVTRSDEKSYKTVVASVDLYRLQAESVSRAVQGDPAAVTVGPDDGIRNLEVISRARGW